MEEPGFKGVQSGSKFVIFGFDPTLILFYTCGICGDFQNLDRMYFFSFKSQCRGLEIVDCIVYPLGRLL